MPFKIWVDADAIPGPVKEIIMNAAVKRLIEATFVANKLIALPSSKQLNSVQVDSAPDAADNYIAQNAQSGDLVITQDIPLASTLVKMGVLTISPRGGHFTEENIGDRLSMRDLMESLRNQGEITGGPAAFGQKEKRAFAATFDRELTRLIATQKS